MAKIKVEESQKAFLEFINARAKDPNALGLTESIDLMLSFYCDQRATNSNTKINSD